MESQSSDSQEIISHLLSQAIRSCNLIINWNRNINSANEYLYSDENIEKMAATCMMIETIGEILKKIDRINDKFLIEKDSSLPWKQIKGLRDKIAHGYYNLDEEIIFDIVSNEVQKWKDSFERIKLSISTN